MLFLDLLLEGKASHPGLKRKVLLDDILDDGDGYTHLLCNFQMPLPFFF